MAAWQDGRLAGKQRDRLTYRQNMFEHGGHAGRRAGRQVDKLAGQVGRYTGTKGCRHAGRQANRAERLTYRQNIIEHGGHAGRRAGRQVYKLAGMQKGKQRDRLTDRQNIFKHKGMLADGEVDR